MATISTRINSSGTYLVNGTFDEITYNRTSPVIKNLLIYTDSFDNAAWGKNAVTILPNTIIAPDGTLTADKIQETAVTTFFAVVQNPTALPSKSYTMSFYAKAGERTQVVVSFTVSTAYVMYNLATGTVTSTSGAYLVGSSITFVGNGWYRCTVSLTSAPSGSNLLYFIIALVNSNSDNYAGTTGFGAYVWGAQIEQNSTVTIYQGIAAASTLVTPTFKNKVTSDAVYVTDIFDEVTYNTSSPVIKNLLIYTDSFDNVNWGKGSVSITANSTTAPDGIIVADTIVENTTPSSYHFINQLFNKTATANTYTYSIYAKDAGRSGIGLRIDNNAGSGAVVTYNVATGAIILGAGTYGSFTSASSNILAVGNGWYRISLTATTDASTTVAFVQNYLHSIPAGTTVYTGDGISGIYIWGAQIEQNSTTTIYQGIAATNTLVAPGFAKRETSDGAVYVTGSFDEVTGIS